MLQQAIDLREECDDLYDFVTTLDDGDWSRKTPFKGWTVWDVIAHLHLFDWVALQSLRSEDVFDTIATEIIQAAVEGTDLAAFARKRFASTPPDEMFELWRACFVELTDGLGESDPELRLKWFGPDMGVRMFTTARQMETWAHGQDIYDLVQVERDHFDRIKNIAVIGVKTFGWAFVVRGLEVPTDAPYVRLTLPSGEPWDWNEPSEDNRVTGTAVDFCRVVTQNRNVADTELEIIGETAAKWMSIAQCFAGGPVEPPAPGERAWELRRVDSTERGT
jgi:uncharacterized protein (TIGR03084 family)